MTYGGEDPFGGDPFGGQGSAYGPAQPGHPGAGPAVFPAPASKQPEVNTPATLSIIFAFVFAPAGAVLGHVALSQLRHRQQRGRERAIVGLTISYIIIALAVIALVVWLAMGSGSGSSPTTPSATSTVHAAPLPPRTTVYTPPPAERPTVNVVELRVGDCVEVQQNAPDPSQQNTNFINIYRVTCQVRDGVLQVTQILSTDGCKTSSRLFNPEKTVYACIVDYKG
jgi:hypothetical protein